MENNWSGSMMVLSAKEILNVLEHMKELNQKLIGDVAAYANVMQDDVKNASEKLVKRINLLVEEIKEQVKEKTLLLDEAGKKLTALESGATNKINDIK